jgi:uncharacterized protein YsxB (DUF464 family)
MAVVEQIRVEGDTSGFQQQIDALNKKIEELEKNLGGVQKETADVGKEAKKTGNIISRAFGGLKKVVTAPFDLAKKAAGGLGTILKGGLGFGLITAAVDKLSESFNANQKVVDAVSKVLATLSIIFNKIAESVFSTVEEQSKLNGGFDATKKVLGGLISGVLLTFVGIIQGITLGVQEAQLAWEKSFFGDKDEKTIDELNKKIAVTREELKKTGEGLLDAGKSVIFNLAEAASEVAGTVAAVATNVVKTIQTIDIKAATDQAERLIELQKQAALADVARQKIQLEFQNTQEQLRQLRDDEQNSLEARQKANQDLLASLEKQAELERVQLNIKVAAAAAEYEINKTNENLVALKQAQLELTDLDERLQGQRSEALSNQNSLLREQLDITRSVAETDQEIFEIRAQSQLDAIRNEIQRAEKEIEIAQSVYDRKKALLEQEVAAAKAGTAARTEAENALRLFEEESYANKVQLERNLRDVRREGLQQTLDLTAQSLSAFANLYSALSSDNEANAERAFRVNKALQLASAIASTAAAVTAQLAVPQDALTGANFVKAGIALTTGLAQVATISKTQFQPDGQGTSSVQSSIPSVQSQPAQFNIVGQSGINQLAQSIGGQFQQPIRAYVVGQDVTTSQQLERQRVRTATFG